MNSLRQRTLVGLGWNGAARLLGQLLQLGITMVLARLLSPREYGLLGMVLVFTGFASFVADMGLGASIIQKTSLSDRHLNSVFWLNAATGLVLTATFVLAAPLIARFYGEPKLSLLTVAIAPNFILGSLNVVQNALLDKALNFRIKFWIEIVAVFASGLVALVLALQGYGVWSLVGQSLALTSVRVLMMWAQSSWRPAMAFDFSAIRELMRFGLVFYWSQNVDKLMIGRWIGSSALGIYTLADKLMRVSVSNINDVTGSVMFPALSSIQHDVEAVRRAYLRASRMTSLIVFPMTIALAMLAEPAVLVIYGGRWRESIAILQLLCVGGVSLSTYSSAGWLYMSQGRTDLLFRLGVYATAVRIIAVLIGSHWGLMGVAWAYVIGGYVFIWYPTWAGAGRLVDLRFRALLANVAGPFGCAALMGAVLWLSDHWIFRGWVVELRLAIQLALGALVYAVLVRGFRVRAWMEIAGMLLEMGDRRSRLLRWVLNARAAR
jgi:O-antigen/teichoic acid export membrane protein